MSKAITIGNAIAARLNDLATLPDVEALVWQQKTIASEMATKLGKASGAVIVILYQGFQNPDADAGSRLNVRRAYTVSVFVNPTLRAAGATTPEDIVEISASALHAWEPVEATTGFGQIHVKSCDLRPDDKFLIYDLDIEVLSRL